MELEELKATWQSVKPEIKSIGCSQKDNASVTQKNDVKSRLLRKVFLGELFSFVCIVLLATSHLWSPTKLPVLWLVSFCAVIVIGIICGIGLYIAIKRVNLWEDSNAEILAATVSIKKRYRKIELLITRVRDKNFMIFNQAKDIEYWAAFQGRLIHLYRLKLIPEDKLPV